MPIKIIKVSSGVTFHFDFALQDGVITANEKEKLFVNLLLFYGVGAKTNVGYGQFQEWSDEDWKKFAKTQERRKKEEEKKGLDGFELFLKELEEFTKQDKELLKYIKGYSDEFEDIDKIKIAVKRKTHSDKFYKKIMIFLEKCQE